MNVFAWLISWSFFRLGQFLSIFVGLPFLGWLYFVYNKCMWYSLRVQDWAQVDGPWVKRIKK
jgi:hypothetical protein